MQDKYILVREDYCSDRETNLVFFDEDIKKKQFFSSDISTLENLPQYINFFAGGRERTGLLSKTGERVYSLIATEHFCNDLENLTEISISRTYHNFWYISIPKAPSIIIKYCPFCGAELE